MIVDATTVGFARRLVVRLDQHRHGVRRPPSLAPRTMRVTAGGHDVNVRVWDLAEVDPTSSFAGAVAVIAFEDTGPFQRRVVGRERTWSSTTSTRRRCRRRFRRAATRGRPVIRSSSCHPTTRRSGWPTSQTSSGSTGSTRTCSTTTSLARSGCRRWRRWSSSDWSAQASSPPRRGTTRAARRPPPAPRRRTRAPRPRLPDPPPPNGSSTCGRRSTRVRHRRTR